jgi:hypothetical protein
MEDNKLQKNDFMADNGDEDGEIRLVIEPMF